MQRCVGPSATGGGVHTYRVKLGVPVTEVAKLIVGPAVPNELTIDSLTNLNIHMGINRNRVAESQTWVRRNRWRCRSYTRSLTLALTHVRGVSGFRL
jgi:hypothetical protein